MGAKFTHYLVTRFNIKIQGDGPEFIHPDARTSSWEARRIPLFETYCAPSVLGQTSKNFIWLIYCDPQTPEPIMKRIQEAVQFQTWVEIQCVDSFQNMIADIQHRGCDVNTPYLITSRLDNDDAIGRTFIEDVQSHFIAHDQTVLNLLGGVNYHAERGILTHLRHKEKNSFISLIEERKHGDELCTIMGFSHLHPKMNMVVKNIPSKYSFWITLHGQNTVLRNNRGWPVFRRAVARNYSLPPKQIRISILNTILYTIAWFPEAFIRKINYQLRIRLTRNTNLT